MAEKKIAEFRLDAEFARVGRATVYSATDEHLEREVLILPVAERALFESMARLRARLTHPAFPALLDISEERGCPFLILERPEGERLSDIIEMSGPPALTETLALFRQLLEALCHARESRVCHPGLAGRDVYLTQTGRVSILGVVAALPEDALEEARALREELQSVREVLTRCLPPAAGLPPRLAKLLADSAACPSCRELLAALSDATLLERSASAAAEEEEPEPKPAATWALTAAFALVLLSALLQMITLGALGALAGLGAFGLGERRRGSLALGVGIVACLTAWLAGGRM
jgi:hypothetical protein